MFLSTIEILLIILVCFGFSTLLVIVNYILSSKNNTEEKLSAYECGFEAFSDARKKFDIRFYIVAILFIMFDLEIIFLIPWTINLSNLSLLAFQTMFIFIFLFFIGFLFEWKEGALDWVAISPQQNNEQD